MKKIFYTESLYDSYCVDVLFFDFSNNTFKILEDLPFWTSESVASDGDHTYNINVNRELFDILLEFAKNNDFAKIEKICLDYTSDATERFFTSLYADELYNPSALYDYLIFSHINKTYRFCTCNIDVVHENAHRVNRFTFDLLFDRIKAIKFKENKILF